MSLIIDKEDNEESRCEIIPMMMKLEDQMVPDKQLGAAYESTKIDHEMKLNVNCTPSPARLTGIMITLGEKNSDISDIMELIYKNVDVVRINVSHRDYKWHKKSITNLRNAIECLCCHPGAAFYPPAIAVDLPGPEIRAGSFDTRVKDVRLSLGDEITICTEGNSKRIRGASGVCCFGICCPELPRASQVGDRILLDRGSVCVEVNEIGKDFVKCATTKEGIIHDKNMIVQPIDTALDVTELCRRDNEVVELALELQTDFLIISHVANWRRVSAIKDRIEESGTRPICILSKISSYQGLENFDEILKVSDGILIDRDSLQIDVKPEKLFLAQKSIIAKCNRVGKPVIVTYRMSNDDRTKLELDLVANAVLEGVDTVFLATGALSVKNTIKLIEDVDLVAREAEAARWQRQIFQDLSYKTTIPLDPTHGMAIAAVEMSMKLNASGIIVTTTTGRSAMLLSIYRPRCPIVAVTRYGIAARWLRVYFAVHPIHYKCPPHPDWHQDLDCRVERAMNYLKQWRYIKTGDPVIVISGWKRGQGFTHSIRVIYATPAALSRGPDDFEDTW